MGWRPPEILGPPQVLSVLDRYAHPGVVGPREPGRRFGETISPLRQDLERVLATVAQHGKHAAR